MSGSREDHSIEKVANDLDLNSIDVVGETVRSNSALVEEALSSRSSFLQNFFPDPARKAIVLEQMKSVEQEFEFRRQVLYMVRQSQMQALKESCNQYLVKGKAAIRADVGRFLLARAAELEAQVNDIFDDFTEDMSRRWEKAESIKSAKIRDIRLKQLDKDFERFAQLQDQLLDKFLKIVSEGV